MIFLCWCYVLSEYDVCDVTPSVCPDRASMKNIPGRALG